MNKLAKKYKDLADKLSAEITHLERVQPDTAYREGFNLESLRRAQGAAETDKVFLGGYAKGVLILGISALGEEKAESFISACAGWKSHANSALLKLDGELGEIRRNQADTCWVIDLASSRRTVMFGWESGPRETRFAGPRLNTTNGGAHWCGLISAMTPFNAEKSPVTVAFLGRVTKLWSEKGMTSKQWNRAENARIQAQRERHGRVVQAAIEAGKLDDVVVSVGFGYNPTRGEKYILAAEQFAGDSGPVPENLTELVYNKLIAERLAIEETRIMAELEAEQIRLANEKAKAEAEARRQQEVEKTCKSAGISVVDWDAMTQKQKGIALHRARLAGKI